MHRDCVDLLVAVGIALLVAVAMLASLLWLVPVAHAMEQCCWQYDSVRKTAPKTHVQKASAPRKQTTKSKKDTVAKRQLPTKVYEYVKEIKAPTPTCAGLVRGVGEQYVSEAGAIDRAIKSWQETVRYDLGESYMDTKNAQDVQFRCARSSIGEVAGQTFQRCEWVARPCRPALSQGSAP